ncbi:thioredoxin domain-containing protein [Microlunatus speluncae]|uniref:thioredoxin domain-containing protein n=1 Tax=Microlunatus speluncae TaxID=2594267 RepID=UPI0012665C6A|nr:thioredoxin domain-containing protein [Microlunatus speluncae]
MVNRLTSATSPYLLQHAENPVDWWEWGPEAFAEARRRDTPILLSVGYAACHWCHVMAHESFEDDEIAAMINSGFVAIKVDREERPDVDAVYMQATQAMTGQGGWPMTVFLTPDRRPFYAGTYFPATPRSGLPSFPQVLQAVGEAWGDRREQIVESAGSITDQLAAARRDLSGRIGPAEIAAAIGTLGGDFDQAHPGFGTAPKFPPSLVLEALLRTDDPTAMIMAEQTLEAMARGGIYDQLAGGFARYSVDSGWVVPHFEKMLYDNALLLGCYVRWWQRTGSPIAERVATETVDWLLSELRTAEGGFASSLDADSPDADGVSREGAYYAWTVDQLRAALGPEDADWAAEAFGVTESGTFEHGASTLQLPHDQDPVRLAGVRRRLADHRAGRPRPGRDDKIITAWNGWLIDALVQAAMIMDRPDWLELAAHSAELIWRVHRVDDGLRRGSRDGRAGDAAAVLEDYAALCQAATRLAAATADAEWLTRAEWLANRMITAFDDGNGGFYDTAADSEQLYLRPQDPTDNATPSGLSAAVHALTLLGELTGEPRYAERAEQAAGAAAALVEAAPRFAGWLLADAITRTERPPLQVAIAGPPDDPATVALRLAAWRLAPAGSVIIAAEPDRPGFALLADRTMVNDRPTAYVCRHFVCRLPVTTVDDLAAAIANS